MSKIFLCSDHHFGHANILTFMDSEGNRVRDFESVEHMDETMVENHNRVVSKSDKVYFLGDVAFTKKNLAIVARLNGEKVLIKGNHDQESLTEYQKYFKDVRGSHQFSGLIFTHIPIHPDSLGRWGCNIHGHLHTNEVMVRGFSHKPVEPDPRYLSVCMERIAFTPITLEAAKEMVKNRLEASAEI
jgi:calcineurin-like phosphoesterase family protein